MKLFGIFKIFKTIDEKIEDLGFVKVYDDEYGIEYKRKNFIGEPGSSRSYMHKVVLKHKSVPYERYILQSYDPDLLDEKKIGNVCVGLTFEEMKLFTKKMKQLTDMIYEREV